MHNNYYLLRALGAHLSSLLPGAQVMECYSQAKDELVIGFLKGKDSLMLHAVLTHNLCMLRFPEELTRARRNTVDLFPEIINLTVSDVYCFRNERCLALELSQGYTLIFKMFDNKANVILCRDNQAVDIFKKRLNEDLQIIPGQLHVDIDIDKERFLQLEGNLKRFLPTLGPVVRDHLQQQDYARLALEDQWSLLQTTLAQLYEPSYYLTWHKEMPALRLLPAENSYLQTQDPLQALNQFYRDYISRSSLIREKQILLQGLRTRQKRTADYLTKVHHRKQELTTQLPFQKMADMIMAHMYSIPKGASTVELPDFDSNEPVEIKLKSNLSPQKNAERYYRKSKNQKKELEILEENSQAKTREMAVIQEHLDFLDNCQNLKELRNYAKDQGLAKKKKEERTSDPFRSFQFQGYTILVGKSATNNDLLTQKAHKEDLWLHAKDVKGSHVVVKHQRHENIPKLVLERAAQLAAYYSKRKHDALCPVAYTKKKFVRKPKGAAAGQVVVEKEKVILVEPIP